MARGEGIDAAARLDVGVEMVLLQKIEAQPVLNTPDCHGTPHAAVNRDRRVLPQRAMAFLAGQPGIKCRQVTADIRRWCFVKKIAGLAVHGGAGNRGMAEWGSGGVGDELLGRGPGLAVVALASASAPGLSRMAIVRATPQGSNPAEMN